MDDGDRKALYVALLRGIGNEAQDRLCASDKQHAWGQWVRYVVRPDKPISGPLPKNTPIKDEAYRVAARRTCQNCGREQFSS